MKNKQNEAAIPNPALKPFEALIGEWKTEGKHPLVPGTIFHGHTSYKWIEGGAFVMMQSEIDEEDIPTGMAIFGSDDALGEYFMLYFDERKISRKFDVSFEGKNLKCWRNAPGFSQRMILTISDDGNTATNKGALSKNSTTWEKDLELTYYRIQ